MKKILLFFAMTIALVGCGKDENPTTDKNQEETTAPLYGKWQFQRYEEFIGGQKQPDDTSQDAKCMLENVLTLTETKYSLTSHSYDESTQKCKSDGSSEYDYTLKFNTITIKNGGQVYIFELETDQLTLISTTTHNGKEIKTIEYYKKIK